MYSDQTLVLVYYHRLCWESDDSAVSWSTQRHSLYWLSFQPTRVFWVLVYLMGHSEPVWTAGLSLYYLYNVLKDPNLGTPPAMVGVEPGQVLSAIHRGGGGLTLKTHTVIRSIHDDTPCIHELLIIIWGVGTESEQTHRHLSLYPTGPCITEHYIDSYFNLMDEYTWVYLVWLNGPGDTLVWLNGPGDTLVWLNWLGDTLYASIPTCSVPRTTLVWLLTWLNIFSITPSQFICSV